VIAVLQDDPQSGVAQRFYVRFTGGTSKNAASITFSLASGGSLMWQSGLDSSSFQLKGGTRDFVIVDGRLYSPDLTELQSGISTNAAAIAAEAAARAAADQQLIPRDISPQLLTGVDVDLSDNGVALDVGYVNPDDGAAGVQTVNLPLASEANAGLIPREAYAQIGQNRDDIHALQESGGAWVGSFATAAALNAYVFAANDRPGDAASVQQDETKNGATTQYRIVSDGDGYLSWEFDMIKTVTPVSQASQTVAGIVKGVDANGKIYVEVDGTMSLVGYDDIILALQSAASGLAQKANIADVYTKSQTDAALAGVYGGIYCYYSEPLATPLASNGLMAQLTKQLPGSGVTYAPGGITVQSAGVYRLSGHIEAFVLADTADATVTGSFWLNGAAKTSTGWRTAAMHVAQAKRGNSSFEWITTLAAGDTVGMNFTISPSTTSVIVTLGQTCSLIVQKVG
jgi:hypothetical protein